MIEFLFSVKKSQKRSKKRLYLKQLKIIKHPYTNYIMKNFTAFTYGEMAEWLKAPHSKCGIGATLSGVQIPLSPPILRKLR